MSSTVPTASSPDDKKQDEAKSKNKGGAADCAGGAECAAPQKHASSSKGLSSFTGPPPVFSIVPSVVENLSETQRKKKLLLRKKIRLQQELLLKHRKSSTAKRELPTTESTIQAAAQAAQITQEGGVDGKRPTGAYLDTPMTGFELNWIVDELNLVRCLQARDWFVQKAFLLLMETVNFRRSCRPERIKPKEVKSLAKKGQIFRRGFDRAGRPLLFIKAKNATPEDEPSKVLDLLVYMLERSVQSMNRRTGVHAITFIMDYRGYTAQNQPPLRVALRFLDIFQNYYFERLGVAFIIDTPWYFTTFWNVISPFLPQRTTSKIKFINTEKQAEVDEIFEAIDPIYVEEWIPGGKCKEAYDHEAYWTADTDQFNEYMKYLQAEFINKTQEQRLSEIKKAQMDDGASSATSSSSGASSSSSLASSMSALCVSTEGSSSPISASATTGKGEERSIDNGAGTSNSLDKLDEEEDLNEEEIEKQNVSKDLDEDEEKRRRLHEALSEKA